MEELIKNPAINALNVFAKDIVCLFEYNLKILKTIIQIVI
jgi:hypothetical protein